MLLACSGCGQARFEERLRKAVGMAADEMAKKGLSPQEKAEMDQKIKAQAEARNRMIEQLKKRGVTPPAAPAANAPAADAAAPAAPAASNDKKPEADYPTPAARAVLASPDALE